MEDNLTVNNRIDRDAINYVVYNTFKEIRDILVDHSGPYGRFAMLTRAGSQIAEPIFTKDGIGIVRSLEYASPIKEIVRNTVAYMGSRIETAAGDGTTSSMILLADGIRYLASMINHTEGTVTNTNVAYSELLQAHQILVDEYTKHAEQLAGTLEKCLEHATIPEKEVLWNIAFSQAWTSSHGNLELSQAVAKLFANTDKEAWNYLTVEKSKYENNKLYSIEIDESQYLIRNITIWPETAKTDELGTSRKRTKAKTIISVIPPGGGTAEGDDLFNRVVKAIENQESLTVITTRGIPSLIQSQLNELFRNYPEHDVCLFLINDDDPKLNDLVCISALSGKPFANLELELDYEYARGDLKITKGIYPESESTDPTARRELIDYLDKIIAKVKSDVGSRTRNEEVKRLNQFRLKLTTKHRTYFKIGGSAYDNATAVDIVLDAIIATKHSLERGFGLGGNKFMLTTLMKIINHYDGEHKKLVRIIAIALIKAIDSFHVNMIVNSFDYPDLELNYDPDYWERSIDYLKLDNTVDFATNCKQHGVKLDSISTTPSAEYERNPCIIQPRDANLEFIKRFGELALKFVYTSRIVVAGGMTNLNKKLAE